MIIIQSLYLYIYVAISIDRIMLSNLVVLLINKIENIV